MQDFPPRIATFFSGTDDAPTPDPDTRSPAAFLRWVLRQQWQVIALSTLACLLWLMPLTFGPYIFGRAVDEGILAGLDGAPCWAGSHVMLGVVVVGGVFGVVFHTLVVRSWLISLYGTTQMVTRKIAQMGHVLPRRSPTGEVLSVASSDSDEFGALTEILARSVAQFVSYLTVAAIVLSMSWQLGVLVLVAAPVLLGAALPLLRPLHRRQQVERSRNSELTSMATDIVAGLRILRGHRRRGDLRPQLRRPVAAGPPGRRVLRASGRRRSRRWACSSPASSSSAWSGSAPVRSTPAS